jgi:hypothetical protein
MFFAASPYVIRAARQATSTVPIVGVDLETDPMEVGGVKSVARPGGNLLAVTQPPGRAAALTGAAVVPVKNLPIGCCPPFSISDVTRHPTLRRRRGPVGIRRVDGRPFACWRNEAGCRCLLRQHHRSDCLFDGRTPITALK